MVCRFLFLNLDIQNDSAHRPFLQKFTDITDMAVDEMVRFIEYGNVSRFKSSLLKTLHKDDLIHYDAQESTVVLSPIGQQYVEKNLPLEF